MLKSIILNSHPWETRAAVTENGILTELYIERAKGLGVSGNIYKGKVERVLPGMGAAFVDIGLMKSAFLYVGDFYDNFEALEGFEDRDGKKIVKGREHLDEEEHSSYETNGVLIEGVVKRGQDVLVQVVKEPLGGKGARVTSHISLPGKYLVLLPTVDRVGVSRRIEDEEQRSRLKTLVEEIKPQGVGFIVRTAGWGKSEGEIKEDMEFLLKLYESLLKKKEKASAPSLIHRELDLPHRLVRDFLTQDVDLFVVDSKQEFKILLEFANNFLPEVSRKIEYFSGNNSIFDQYGLEMEIKRALDKKVWLKSGGYIIVEITEALTAIDVNTGRFVGKRDLEDTIFRTNLEAVKEIAYQLKLRNIGGLIIIDLIDMEKAKNREKVYSALEDALKSDPKKTNILKISELGLVEMTRKRTRESLIHALTDICPYCEGHGYVKSMRTVCYDIFRELIKDAKGSRSKKIVIMVNSDVAGLLYDEEQEQLLELEEYLGTRVVIKNVPHLHVEEYDITYL
jgi:ribonuclease G